jgi:hypothetical protein
MIKSKMSLRLGLMMALTFLLGLRNARDLMDFLPFAALAPQIVMVAIIAIVTLFSVVLLRSFGRGVPRGTGLKYFMPLIVVIMLKYLFLFLMSPDAFINDMGMGSPTGYFESNFSEFCLFTLVIFPAIIVLLYVRDFHELALVNLALVAGCAVAPIVSFIFFPEMIGSRDSHVGVAIFTGGFWNSSVIGLVVTLWTSLSLRKYYSRKQAALLLTLLAFITTGALVGLSRTAFICLGSSCVTYFLFSKAFLKKAAVAALVIASVFIVLRSFDTVAVNLEKRLTTESNLKEDPRMGIWKDYSEHLLDFLAFGVWMKQYKSYSTTGYGPHSIYLNWLVRFGVPGLLAFFWLLSGLVLSAFRIGKFISRERMAMTVAWLVAYLALSSYNEAGFIEPGVYLVMSFILIQARFATVQYLRSNPA